MLTAVSLNLAEVTSSGHIWGVRGPRGNPARQLLVFLGFRQANPPRRPRRQ